MSKIERFQGNVRAFASDAQGMERTVFGGTNQADDLTSQITASFLRGWGIVGASEHPSLEDFNAAMYAMSQFIAYQHQMGVAEWHAQQEYHIGSICTHNGESYQSLQDANIGNEPPSSNWTPVLTSKNGLSNLQLGEAAKVSLGVDQNYVNVTSTRQSGVVYTNSTGKPILVSVSVVSEQNKSPNTLLINGIEVASCGVSPVAGVYSTSRGALVAVVGNGKTYQISGSGTIISWSELR
ncbi:hypothetical protein ACPX3Z_003747 [Citrobacter amalonaticus]